MDLASSSAAVVVARAGHTPQPCAAMEVARSGMALLSGGSANLYHIDPCRRLRPRASATCRAPCAAQSGRTAAIMPSQGVLSNSCCCILLVCPIMIGIESPIAHRPRVFYSGIGIDFIDIVSEYYTHLF